MSRRPRSPPAAPTGDAALLAALSGFLAADKTLSSPVAWVEDNGDLRFACPLDIDGITAEGFTLFGRASAGLPDRKVTLGLRWQNPAGRGGNFDRLEWRPLKAHVNRANAPADLRLRVIEGSHHHPLARNAALDIGLIRAIQENLPVAEPLDPDPPDWPGLLRDAARRWRIASVITLPPPPWQYGLLPLISGRQPQGGVP